MKLSLVFELLLIFVLLAFAASKNIRKQKNNKKGIQNRNDEDKVEDNSINKYCKCSEALCNCCREFALPYVNLDGPGCASLRYLNGDKMSVSLSFGRKVITNKTLSSRKPSPVCMPLPGGISKFCGRVYNIGRAGEEFRACLGLELQSKRTVEAAVRVSCFKFGPRGVQTEPADPLPLVPKDEKDDEDDDDDDDDDDDYGLDADDDDDDLDAINDVDSADYTGFSLLGEDLLGDLFGSSSGKKSNKNKKKQAPAVSTTTTKRPRPSRRPTRRPSTKNTTPKSSTAKPTTVKVRPGRRPIRRPTRRPSNSSRPSRRPTTSQVAENSIVTSISQSTTPVVPHAVNPSTPSMPTTERNQFTSTMHEETFEPVVIVTQRPLSTLSLSTTKPVNNFEDPGLEMSLAHITGQLSAMPVTPLVTNNGKDASMMSTSHGQISFEKIETITPKATTAAFVSSSERVNDDMVQIVHNLESSEEHGAEKETMAVDESRSHVFGFTGNKGATVQNNYYEGLALPKQNKNNEFSVEDLDVLDLTQIGESVGDQFGLFGRNKRQNRDNEDTNVHGYKEDNEFDILGLGGIGESVGKELGFFGGNKRQNKNNKDAKVHGHRQNEDDDMLGLDSLGETLGLERSDKNNGKIKKNRRRQNKMMRGEWSQV